MSKKSTSTDVRALQANDTNLTSTNDDQAIKDQAIKVQAIADNTKALESAKSAYETAKADLKKLTGKPAKSNEPRTPGVIATIFSLVSSSKKGISKQEMLDKLVELFPDREKSGMEKTIQVQLCARMNKEKKVNIVKENELFILK